jgi:serine/threonine protein kinase
LSSEQTQSELATAKAIFLDACGLSAAQRSSLIEQRCAGAPSLRAAVESLLEANDSAGEFLEEPVVNRDELAAAVEGAIEEPAAGERGATAANPAESLPRMVGRYKLLELIGEGGFGAVYMAEQQEPVRRRVAVKVIKLGMDTRQVIARFEAERQALAMMDHPNIAQVFDAGADDGGRPYFVMELVRGVPITEYCDRAELSTRQRLELFISVCHAVQHAHQKGVIHRDIKPSNILVTLHDGTPVPKVIDFGIAKAMNQQRLTERTMFTAFRQFLGTPQYMSPEQAEMSGLDVDTRSDVYSLGALLYELLTGTTPLEEATLREAAYERVWQMVREADPPRPSTRVSTMGAARTASVAAHRQSDPGRLAKLLRGELDWVVMKALEKARERRYESAGSLAADLRRYLDDEPVQARPTSLAYQLTKLAKRHRTGVAAAVAVGAALVIGISGTTIGMLRARAAQKHAQSAERTALQERNAAREAQLRAERSADEARREAARATAVGESLRGILGAVRPNVDAGNPYTEAAQILGTITAQISGKLKDQPEEQVQARATLADTLQRVESYDEAIEQWRTAYKLSASLPDGASSRRTLDLACNLIFAKYLNHDADDAEAGPLARWARDAALKSLGEGDPVTWKAINGLALTRGFAGPRQESHALWDSLIKRMAGDPRAQAAGGGEALARYTANWAAGLREQGRAAEADAAMAMALRVLGQDKALSVEQRGRIAREISTSLETWGDLPDALLVRRDTLRDQRESLGNDHSATRLAMGTVAGLLIETDRFDEAGEVLREYVPSTLRDNPRGTITFANRLVEDAWVKLRAGDRTGAGERFGQSLAMRRRLLGHDNWVSEEDWRMWTMCCSSTLGTGWTSRTIRDHAWCALQDMLRDNTPARLVPQEVRIEQLRFTLLRWPQAAKIAEGGLDELKSLAEPPAGLYVLGLQVPTAATAAGSAVLARANWLLVWPWEVNVYAMRRPDVLEANWAQAVAGEPAEMWHTSALAINGGLGLVSGDDDDEGRRRRWHWFGVIARTRLDLPPGRYRISASAHMGVKVQLDGRTVLGSWFAAGATEQVEVDVTSGSHELRVDYYQKGTYQNLWLQVTPISDAARQTAMALGGGMPWLDSEIGNARRRFREHPEAMDEIYWLAHLLGRRGRFEESAATVGKAIPADPASDLPWYVQACVLGHLNDGVGHEEVCRAMVARFGGSTDPAACRRVAMACLIASEPATSQRVQRARQLIERARGLEAAAGRGFWERLVEGLLDYRSGQFEQAAAGLALSLADCPEDAYSLRAAIEMYLAMSQSGLRQEAEALATFRHARMLMDAHLGKPSLDDLGQGGLENWLIAQVARREAERLFVPRLPSERP